MLGIIGGALLLSGTAFAGPCLDRAINAVAAYGATPTQITEEAVYSGGEGGNLVGYRFWMSVDLCSQGVVVVDTTDYCYVQQTYSRWGCRIPGMPAY